MGQSKWNEEKIIQILRDFPAIEDRQKKEELFAKIEKRIDSKKTKRKPFRIMPMLAAACVLIIAAIISPVVLQETVLKKPGSETGQKSSGSPSEPGNEPTEIQKIPEEPIPPASGSEGTSLKAEPSAESEIEPKAYESHNVTYHSGVVEVPQDKQVVTVYYTDSRAEGVVPVSYLADKELPKIEALQQAFQMINPDKLGVLETVFHEGDKVKVSDDLEKKTLIVDIKPGVIQGGTGERMFMDTVNYTAFNLGYEKIVFKTSGEPGYDFPHIGPQDMVEIESPKGVSTLLTDNGTLLLVEGTRADESIDGSSLEENIRTIKIDTSRLGHEEAIQPSVFIKEVNKNEKTVSVELVEGSRLENNMMYIAMIEAMLLTSGQFGFEYVQILGSDTKEVGPYNLAEPIPVLKAPNVISK
ncbi:hypothetical protein [Pseudalkalibacillus salsuginis]|uniref:hypothetical protein n=1 Tax=Pseudalkalibacillus salsuginis TaxID=2910972 RepID=UPI001F456B65|nr:hypothetical protein [Pseudalkalibacillus salsuginis]MCF6411778.1 hypothetical protein [Pseudalkalibacillus salsuginis]